ncbi:MAG: hypothetical protein KDE27_08100, partial [Planctomycetes bacterium]|nr:hypothetical protein [Planctomycetota bacterium]
GSRSGTPASGPPTIGPSMIGDSASGADGSTRAARGAAFIGSPQAGQNLPVPIGTRTEQDGQWTLDSGIGASVVVVTCGPSVDSGECLRAPSRCGMRAGA